MIAQAPRFTKSTAARRPETRYRARQPGRNSRPELEAAQDVVRSVLTFACDILARNAP